MKDNRLSLSLWFGRIKFECLILHCALSSLILKSKETVELDFKTFQQDKKEQKIQSIHQ